MKIYGVYGHPKAYDLDNVIEYQNYVDGIKDIGDVPLESIISWIKVFCIPTKTYNYGVSSYGLKHVAEKCFGSYITNDGMKKAMAMAGYYPYDYKELNWNFCLSKRSPLFLVNPEDVCAFKHCKNGRMTSETEKMLIKGYMSFPLVDDAGNVIGWSAVAEGDVAFITELDAFVQNINKEEDTNND